jgi:hypothetical protein
VLVILARKFGPVRHQSCRGGGFAVSQSLRVANAPRFEAPAERIRGDETRALHAIKRETPIFRALRGI